LTWGVPLAVLVLLAAVAGGAITRTLYARADRAEPTAPLPTSPKPTEQPGSSVVELLPGAQEHADHETVRVLLQTHFDAINVRRYDTWKTTVVSERRRQLPESKWRAAYGSTHDGSVKVHWIESGPDDSLRVMLTVTSVQNPTDAPPTMRVPCLRWRSVYPLVQDSGGLRLDTALPGNSLFEKC
jgi:hypothetical protein